MIEIVAVVLFAAVVILVAVVRSQNERISDMDDEIEDLLSDANGRVSRGSDGRFVSIRS